MRILIATHRYAPDLGGVEEVARLLAVQWHGQGHEVRVLVAKKSLEEISRFEEKYDVVREPSFRQVWEAYRWSDVVLHNNICARLLWPAFLFRRPIASVLHTYVARPDGSLNLADRLKRGLLRRIRTIAVSKYVRDYHSLPSNVIANAYRSDNFRDLALRKTRDLVFVGRLVPDKGVGILLQALAVLARENPSVTLTVIGEGAERENLEEMTLDLGLSERVVFAGPRRDMDLAQDLNRHRIIVVPSVWDEPFGIVALEGIACGCIPVVAASGGLPDATGDVGFVFAKGNVMSLVENLRRALRQDVDDPNFKGAVSTHLNDHQPKAMADAYLGVLCGSEPIKVRRFKSEIPLGVIDLDEPRKRAAQVPARRP